MEPTTLKIAGSKDAEECAAYLSELADKARNGEFIAFAGTLFRPGGAYTIVGWNSANVPPTMVIGGLFAAATRTHLAAAEAALGDA
jgi:hypothetical protein